MDTQTSSRFDRDMAADEVVFIVDAEGRSCKIVGGKNLTVEDRYVYTIQLLDRSVLQVGEEGFVEGFYDAHDSLEEIDDILTAYYKAPKGP
jgi:hypothetical protein